MKISPYGLALVKAFEGLMKAIPGKPGFVTTYRDEVGVLTIGYGHTNLGNIPPKISPGDVWDMAQVNQALQNDFAKFDTRANGALGTVPQCVFDACDSFDFNTGSLLKSSIPGRIKSGDMAGAVAILLQYNHAGGKVLAGLTRRRQAEALMMQGKVIDALKLAGAHVTSGDFAGGSSVAVAPAANTTPSTVSTPTAAPATDTPPGHQETLLGEISNLIAQFQKSIGL